MPAGARRGEQVRERVHTWLDEHWHPELSVREWWSILAESGWGFPTWPREHFGRGLPAETAAVVREVFVDVGALGPPAGLGQTLGGPTLIAHGTDAQKAEFLPRLAAGTEGWCQLFSEPGSGSDLASAQTRLSRDGNRWLANGQKVWTSGAQLADRGMLVARTDAGVPKHRGLTYVVIDMDQPGVEVRPLHQMNGEHGFNEVFLTDAVVANDRVVGEENDGWAVAVTTLMFERFMASLPSAIPGRHSEALDRPAGEVLAEVGRDARSRSFLVNGLARPLARIAAEQGAPTATARHLIAGLYALEEVDRFSAQRQTDTVLAGDRPSATGSLRKLARSSLGRARAQAGMATLGAQGLLVGSTTPGQGQIQQLALSTPGTSIAGGTDEVQKNIIGERVLGLPKEPVHDRNVSFRDLRIGTQSDESS